MKTYEAMLIFASGLKDNELDTALERAKGDITRVGGSVQHVKVIGKRTFARPMHKQEAGIYAWIAFEAETGSIADLRKRFKLNDEVFRVQVLAADEKALAKYLPQPEADEVAETADKG